jgi:hypothetical protein
MLQLFMVMQARVLAQYAVGRAVRMGALNFGSCAAMQKSAIAILLPAIDPEFARRPTGGGRGGAYGNLVASHLTNRYLPGRDAGRDGPIVWMWRVSPLVGSIGPDEEDVWNLAAPQGPEHVLAVRMVFWAPLKIPFANWVFLRMAMAHWGLRDYDAVNPLSPTHQSAGWTRDGPFTPALVAAELQARYDAQQFVFPVEATAALRMMSPARFSQQNCPQ